MSKEVLNATQDDLARQFAAGQLAMMINGSWNIERLEEAEDLNYRSCGRHCLAWERQPRSLDDACRLGDADYRSDDS